MMSGLFQERLMNKLLKFLDKAMSFILIALVMFLAVGVSVTVVLRYFFGLSFSTLEEFLTMAFIFTTLFGSALAIREKQHISISYLADKVVGKSRTRKIISVILIDGSILFVCAMMINYSIKWIGQVGHLLSPNSHLPMSVYYIFVPFPFAITAFYLIVDILSYFIRIENADGGYATDDVLPEDK